MTGMDDIKAERRRQVEAEGYSSAHDAEHPGEMAKAAWCYENHAGSDTSATPPEEWPWEPDAWKPKDLCRDLVRAGALYLAEAERLDDEARYIDWTRSVFRRGEADDARRQATELRAAAQGLAVRLDRFADLASK